ncbi:MAG: hypothetical protein ACW99A_18750, partial [Candidatus Kariarchaeaceae archaeon]
YKLTDIGLLLIESLEDFTGRLSRRRVGNPMAYLMSKPRVERIIMTKNEVKNIPKYQASGYTLIGSTTGILQSFGEKFDTTDVAGYTGQAFLACMTKGITSAAPPTAHAFFEEVHEGTESMGYKLTGDYEPGAIFPTKKIKLEDQKRLIKLFETIKEQIDKNNPVILWGPLTAEFSIVYGYEDDNYLVSSYRSAMGKKDQPIHYQDLHLPGGIWYYYFGERTHQMTEEHDLEAIKRALVVALGRNQPNVLVGIVEFDDKLEHVSDWDEKDVQFASGPEAFTVWKYNIEKGQIHHMGNAHVAYTYQDGYERASEFLNRLANKYEGRKFYDKLVEVSGTYSELSDALSEYCKIFPFPDKGGQTQDQLDVGASLLGRCERHTRKAIDLLTDVAELWEED